MPLSSAEQLLIEMVNRARLDPEAEAARYGIDLNADLPAGTLGGEARQALAPNQLLHDASEVHADWMLAEDTFSHAGEGGSSPGDRMAAAGYVFAGSFSSGENLTYTGSTDQVDLDTLMEDHHHRDLFLSSGHRVNMLHDFYRELGVSQQPGVFTANGTDYNVGMVVENFASSGPAFFVTGVHYNDLDADGFYSIGEGVGGTEVVVAGNRTVTATAGGYGVAHAPDAAVAVSIGSYQVVMDLSQSNGKLDLIAEGQLATSVDTTLVTAASLTALGVGNIDLTGSDGADVLIGNRGDNILDGGAGEDRVRYTLSIDEASLTQSETGVIELRSSGGVDTLRNIEFVEFTDGEIDLTAHFAPDPLAGASGETLTGTAATDHFYAGGFDAGLVPHLAGQVYRLYLAALGREGDTGGHAGWTQALLEGTNELSDVAAGFVNSPEFRATYGALDNGGFVDLLYQNVLGRAADTQGRAGWVAELDSLSMSRAEVLIGFSQSAEFVSGTAAAAQKFITARNETNWSDDIFRLYTATLDRAPDLAGFEGWTDSLSKGAAFTDVVAGFVEAQEFRNTYGNLDDAAFVELLYRNVLDRAPDSAGGQGWRDALADGMPRTEVVQAFVESPEFIRDTQSAVTNWVQAQGLRDVIESSGGSDVLAGGALRDAFVFEAGTPTDAVVLDLEAWDSLYFRGFGYQTADVALSHISTSGADAIFADQGVTVTFQSVETAMITQDMILI